MHDIKWKKKRGKSLEYRTKKLGKRAEKCLGKALKKREKTGKYFRWKAELYYQNNKVLAWELGKNGNGGS